jgi:hypothetical protein
VVDGSTLLIPTAPSDAWRRTTTQFVVLFVTPPLVKLPVSGIATPNASICSILTGIPNAPRLLMCPVWGEP